MSSLSPIEYQELKSLRERCAKLERTVDFLLHHFELTYVDEPPNDVDPDIFQLVKAGKSIDAIKLYRERTGADLLTAKNYIQSLGG